jgi:hypothetical protein
MSDKQLKDKAVKIQGKDYVLVSDRVLYFNDVYKNGFIQTELLTDLQSGLVVVKATVTPDVSTPERKFTGYSQEKIGDGFINKTSALENAETSAVGRALAMMGIGVIESIASVDEINKAKNQSEPKKVTYATAKQIDWMRDEARKVSGFEHNTDVDAWLEKVLTIPPHKVPVFKVHSAVDRIREQADPPGDDPEDSDITVTDEDLEKVAKGEVPY